MKTVYMIIGIVLTLALCTGPVGALCGADFEDVFEVVDGVDTCISGSDIRRNSCLY